MVYETLVSIQQQQPEWIVERHRQSPLSQCKIMFVCQLQDLLEQMHRCASIAAMLKQFLQQICTDGFFQSVRYGDLLKQIDQEFFSRSDDRLLQLEPIAILLLDVENIRLEQLEEQALSSFSTYPIRVKVAVANWRGLGKQDIDLHDRGYQMIHVPSGKNAADIQMTAIGSSLFLQYPHAKEVFVCSNDGHLIMLCNLLQSQGWKVHGVGRFGHQFRLTDWTTGRIQLFELGAGKFDPHDELEQRLAKLLVALTAHKPGSSVSVGALASHFQKHYGFGVTEIMRSWKLGSHFPKFLRSCEMFRVMSIDSDCHVAIHPLVTASELRPSIFDRVAPV
ncbi:NYN domain-containing protein [Leptolyngbya sp. FACHB-1515]